MAVRSPRAGAPVLIWPQPNATAISVLRFARAVAHHDAVAGRSGERGRLHGLGHGPDLIDFEQQRVPRPAPYAHAQPFHIGDEHVVAHQLQAGAGPSGQLGHGVEVVLEEGILQAYERIPVPERKVHVSKFTGGKVLPVQGVSSVRVELGGRGIHGQEDILAWNVASCLYRLHYGIHCLGGGVHGRSETTLVADVDRADPVAVAQQLLQGVIYFRPHAQRLGEGSGPRRHDHELLNAKIGASVLASVEDVHARHRHDVGASGEVLVQLHALDARSGLGTCQGHRDGSIGAQTSLVRSPIQLDHGAVDGGQVEDVHPLQGRSDLPTHVLNGLQGPLSDISPLVPVPQLDGLVAPGGRSRRRNGGGGDLSDGYLRLHCGVPSRVQDLTGPNPCDILR